MVRRSGESGRQQQASLSLGSSQQHEPADQLHGQQTNAVPDSAACQNEGQQQLGGEQLESQEDEEQRERREVEERKARRRQRLAERKLAAANSGYYQPCTDDASADGRGETRPGTEEAEAKVAGLGRDGEHLLGAGSEDRRRLSSPLDRQEERDDAHRDTQRHTETHERSARDKHRVSMDSGIQMSQQEIVSQQGLSQRHNKRSYKDKMRLLGLS